MACGCAGYYDGADDGEVRGWAVRETHEDQIAQVDVLIDGKVEARLWANDFRQDLCDAKVRHGYAAFRFEVPEQFRDGSPHVIDVKHAGTEMSLSQSPKPFKMSGRQSDKRGWCRRSIILEDTIDEAFVSSLEATRKLAIFATYHSFPMHLVYHRQILQTLTSAGFTVIVVHAADIHHHGLVSVDIPNCFTVLKRNIGYDFGSYVTGLLCIGEHLELADELLLMNDSVLPIVPDFAPLLEQLRTADADVVSCTDSYERHYHLQSYILWFSAEACRSQVLARLMTDYSFTSIKDKVIEEGEIGLSRAFQKAGFRLKALYDYTSVASTWIGRYPEIVRRIHDLPGRPDATDGVSFKTKMLDRLDHIASLVMCGTPTNPSHFFWDTLIEDYGFPFIKRELVIVNPCGVPTYFKIAELLSRRTEARDALLDMRRKFGGDLVPAFVGTDCKDHRAPPLKFGLRRPQLVYDGPRVDASVRAEG